MVNHAHYRFTAPVAGIYYISYGGIVGDGIDRAGAQYYAVIVNGVPTYYSLQGHHSASGSCMHIEVMLKLAGWRHRCVGDEHRARPGLELLRVARYQSNHNTCTIWLVG